MTLLFDTTSFRGRSENAAGIAIGTSIGKLALDADFLSLADETGFEWIAFTAPEAILVPSLRFHHRDRFDCMLVCQALHRRMPLMTDDPKIVPYRRGGMVGSAMRTIEP